MPRGNGDQVRLCRYDGRQWSAAMPVTEGLADVWKPTVAIDGAGKVWVAWSQNKSGNWDIYRRSYDPASGAWSAIEQVTRDPEADVNVVAATDSDNLLDNRPVAVPFGSDGLMAVYSSDARLRGANHSVGVGIRPLKNDLYCAIVPAGQATTPPQLKEDDPPAKPIAPVHPFERQNIRQLRDLASRRPATPTNWPGVSFIATPSTRPIRRRRRDGRHVAIADANPRSYEPSGKSPGSAPRRPVPIPRRPPDVGSPCDESPRHRIGPSPHPKSRSGLGASPSSVLASESRIGVRDSRDSAPFDRASTGGRTIRHCVSSGRR